MEEVFEAVVHLLEQYKLEKTINALKSELKTVQNVVLSQDREKSLLSILSSNLSSNQFSSGAKIDSGKIHQKAECDFGNRTPVKQAGIQEPAQEASQGLSETRRRELTAVEF